MKKIIAILTAVMLLFSLGSQVVADASPQTAEASVVESNLSSSRSSSRSMRSRSSSRMNRRSTSRSSSTTRKNRSRDARESRQTTRRSSPGFGYYFSRAVDSFFSFYFWTHMGKYILIFLAIVALLYFIYYLYKKMNNRR